MTFPQDSRRSRALVITADAATLGLVSDALADAFVVDSARDGWLGLEKASDSGLDLVITDVALPRLSAAEMVAAIREQRHLDGLPILVLSSAAEADARAA